VEEVPAAERETEGRLRNVVPAIASALRPGAMIGRPVLRTALLEGRVPWAVRYTLLRLLLPGLLSMLLWLLEGLACLSSCFPPSSPFCAYTEKHGDPGYFDEFMFVSYCCSYQSLGKGSLSTFNSSRSSRSAEPANQVSDEENQHDRPKSYTKASAGAPASMAVVTSATPKKQYQNDDEQ